MGLDSAVSIFYVELLIIIYTISTLVFLIQCCKKKSSQATNNNANVAQNQSTPQTTLPIAPNANQPQPQSTPQVTSAAKEENANDHKDKQQNPPIQQEKKQENAQPNTAVIQLKEDETQIDETPEEKREEDVVNPLFVAKLGNLDYIAKEKRGEVLKEIELMKSLHEMEGSDEPPMLPQKHVIIVEKRCKLYETTDEPTLDDEIEDNAI